MHSQRSLLALLLIGSLAREKNVTAPSVTRQRLLIIMLMIGVVLDLVISLALGYVAVEARNASNQAHIVKVAAYEACLANNEAKAADLKRWNDVLALLKDDNTNPALLQFIKGVQKTNTEADAPHNCSPISP